MRVLSSLFNLYLLHRYTTYVYYTPILHTLYYTRYTTHVYYIGILTYSFNSSNLHRTFEVEVEDQYHAENERDEDEYEIVV